MALSSPCSQKQLPPLFANKSPPVSKSSLLAADVRLTAAERRGGGRSGDGTGRYFRRLFVFWLLFFLGSFLFCHRNHSSTASAAHSPQSLRRRYQRRSSSRRGPVLKQRRRFCYLPRMCSSPPMRGGMLGSGYLGSREDWAGSLPGT